MQATIEPLENSRIKLHIAVDAVEFETAIDAAFRKIAKEVRLPGFRPGKAPRKILEARLGVDAARSQALQDALPGYYADAVIEHDVDVIAAPQITITAGEDDGDVEFDAVVEIRPQVRLMGYDELRVVLPYRPVDDEAVDAQVNRLREQYAETIDSNRPLALGDYATIDIRGSIDGADVEGLTASEFHYKVGSGGIVVELDEALRGTKPGEILEFDAELPERFGENAGATATFKVMVKAAQEVLLPDLSDAWVDETTEFDTVDELRASVRQRADLMARAQAQMMMRDKVLESAAELVTIPAPETLVDEEMRTRINDLAQRLAQQGANLDQYLAATGQEPEAFLDSIRESATNAVLADLALRAVVAQQDVVASDEEVEEEIGRVAERIGQKVEKVRRDLDKGGYLEAVRSDLARGKALQFLVDHATVVDEEGNPVDIALDLPDPDLGAAPSTDSEEGSDD